MPISTKQLDLYKNKDSDDSDDSPLMPLSKHLDELRIKIIVSLIVLTITTTIGFTYSKEVIRLLTSIAPQGTTFLQIKPGEFFFTSFRIALYIGLLISSPLIIWQLSSFILPGLNHKERKMITPILISSPLLFCLGILFSYFFVAPSMLSFLFGFGKDVILTSISIESFISFTLMIMAICGCAFLLPVLIFALANIGIVNSQILIKNWRYAILTSVVSGALLTPTPDPFNMSIVSGILIVLYGVSIIGLKLSEQSRKYANINANDPSYKSK